MDQIGHTFSVQRRPPGSSNFQVSSRSARSLGYSSMEPVLLRPPHQSEILRGITSKSPRLYVSMIALTFVWSPSLIATDLFSSSRCLTCSNAAIKRVVSSTPGLMKSLVSASNSKVNLTDLIVSGGALRRFFRKHLLALSTLTPLAMYSLNADIY